MFTATEYVEGYCGRLTVVKGLQVGQSVKVTYTSWSPDNRDLIIRLVTDENLSFAMARLSTDTALSASGGDRGSARNLGGDQLSEKPAMPLVGVRIPGTEGSGPNSRTPAVLMYESSPEEPKVISLNSSAGPTKPTMVIFTKVSQTDLRVTIYTYFSE